MLYVTQAPEVGSPTRQHAFHLRHAVAGDAEVPGGADRPPQRRAALAAEERKNPPRGYDLPRTEHPLVIRYPNTGRKLLLINEPYTSAVLDMLDAHLARTPVLHCRVRWQPNPLVLWDNRCVQHHAVWDYFPHGRHGRRASITGTRPRA
ncbi:TauD/TfdA family dioxygenase [Streptomyces sp. NPDC001835]|uniref:TauD/TfdA dioxygenase family protein n=1 Tax=Streptomyces sp. NPDC001835 TaxID=3154528 RepID=UPI003330CB1A